jgi:nucleotide-binding universal stress UspA family protein
MAYKTLQLLVNVNEDAKPNAVIEYAIEFARRETAHLSSLEFAQLVDFPIGRLLPLADAIVEEFNDERLSKANSINEHIEVSARLAGVSADCSVVQQAPESVRNAAVTASRMCDLVIAPKSKGVLSTEQSLIEAVLFGSGRPVLIVPPEWDAGPLLETVVVAWDGGARAARAIGDAMPLLEKAGRVEVVCVTSDRSGDARGAELARHLSRHCKNLSVENLPLVRADAGRTLMDHLCSMRPSLLVMGAFAHARLLQHVVGGTTSLMLTDAKVPVLYSY